jgi:hypothetical protein
MLSSALLVVFVMSPARLEPTRLPFEQAAQEVLGTSAEVRLQGVASGLSDAAALERAGAADGVVELRWQGAETVLLHCYVAGEQRWVDRAIQFAPADREPERARMLGFAVASMFADARGFARARSAERATADAEPVATRSSVALASPAPAPSSAASDPGAGVVDAATASELASEPGGGPRSLEFAGVATTGLAASSAAEVGALAALGVPLAGPVSLRLQLAGREGEMAAAQANIRRATAGVGLSWDLLPASGRVALRLRADALGSWFQVSHLSDDDVASVKNHGWLFGGDAVVTAGYRISSLLTVSIGVGAEAMMGQAHVFTHGVERATVPAARGVAELGFLTRF